MTNVTQRAFMQISIPLLNSSWHYSFSNTLWIFTLQHFSIDIKITPLIKRVLVFHSSMKDMKRINYLKFQVLTAVVMKIWILWEVTPCWLVHIFLHFKVLWFFHIHGLAVFLGCWTLKMKVLGSIETSVTVCLSTQHEILED